MFNKKLLGTDKKKTKLSWFDYYFLHCWMTGWQSFGMAFRNWRDLITGNYEGYAILDYEDPYTECYEWFWATLGEDETYPKHFLEDLMEMCDRIDRGEEKLIPFTLEDMKRLSDLVDGVELDD